MFSWHNSVLNDPWHHFSRQHQLSADMAHQIEEEKVIYVTMQNNIQLWLIILTVIKFNHFYFCISVYTHPDTHTLSLRTPGKLWKRSNSAQLWKWFTIFSIALSQCSLHPFCLSLSPPPLSLTVSVSLAPWRHVKCAQISVMGWEFINFTLRPFMRSHPGEVCLLERSTTQ